MASCQSGSYLSVHGFDKYSPSPCHGGRCGGGRGGGPEHGPGPRDFLCWSGRRESYCEQVSRSLRTGTADRWDRRQCGGILESRKREGLFSQVACE